MQQPPTQLRSLHYVTRYCSKHLQATCHKQLYQSRSGKLNDNRYQTYSAYDYRIYFFTSLIILQAYATCDQKVNDILFK